MDKRERWFNEGAPLFQKAMQQLGIAHRLPTGDLYYACPCCLFVFPYESLAEQNLTIEHVPPEALGGKGMLLTCKRCNNDAGRDFDSHAQKRAEFQSMMAGKGTSRPMRAVFEASGIKVNGEAQSTGNGWFLQGVAKQNHPEKLDAHEQALRAATERGEAPGFTFTLKDRFSSQRADVSWVRSAYLAAFSALGWRYILQPALNPIRQQIKPGSSANLPSIIGFNPDHDIDSRQILIVEEPVNLNSVAVVIGQYTIFLPDPWGSLTVEQLAESIGELRDGAGKVQCTLNGKIVPWPNGPMYLLDKMAS
ncbi:HNH endonuclease [Streptomyces sp. NPDC127066]|uniref:HNH endonuclease n=1 Tax=Streptomyces sp. NPDC127066 TaxID=3347125 RepID=UPI0036649282